MKSGGYDYLKLFAGGTLTLSMVSGSHLKLFAGETLMLSMVSEDLATKMKDEVESGGYDHLELFASGTSTLLMVSEDSAVTCHHDDEGQGGVREICPPLGLLANP